MGGTGRSIMVLRPALAKHSKLYLKDNLKAKGAVGMARMVAYKTLSSNLSITKKTRVFSSTGWCNSKFDYNQLHKI
jgi:hypothetical protein